MRGERPARRTTPAAYDRVLAARSLIRRRNKEALLEARDLLRQALAIDPNYALAHALLAQATLLLSSDHRAFGDIPITAARAEAKRLSDRALELDPRLAEGWVIRGQLLEGSPESLKAYTRAAELDPGLAEAWIGIGQAHGFLTQKSIPYFRKAVEAEPLWLFANRVLVTSLHRDAADADRVIARYFAASGDPRGREHLRFWAAKERRDSSITIAAGRELMKSPPIDPAEASSLSFFLMDLGLADEALKVLPATESITRMAFLRQYDALMDAAVARGPEIWLRGRDARVASKVMAAMGRRADLVKLYDAAYGSGADFYTRATWAADLTPGLYLALKEAGRSAEADDLLARLTATLTTTADEAVQPLLRAELLTLQQRDEEAIAMMDRAVDRGWRYIEPPVFPSFADGAVLSRLKGNPRFKAVLDKYRRRTQHELQELAQGR